jgi:long-chain acyl-CoA synthetase
MHAKFTPTPMTLQSLINHTIIQYATYPSVSFVDTKPITYKQLGDEIERISEMLYGCGLQAGDKVALYSQNMPNWVVAYFAVVSKGMVIVPVLPDFTADEIANVLEHSGASVLFVSEKLYSKIEGRNFETLKAIIRTDDFEMLSGVAEPVKSKVKPYKVAESDLAAIIYTSGTTGRSKGVMLTHKNICFVAMQSFTVFPINHNDVFLSFLPLSHTYENSIGMLYPVMYGASIYYLDKVPTAATLLPALSAIKPTMMLSVPLIMEKIYKNQVLQKFSKNKFALMIYKTPLFRLLIHKIAGKKLYKTFGGRLKFFGIGGAKLDSRVERFLKEGGFPYAIGYGLTETAPLLAGAAPFQTKIGSTGHVMEGVQLKINKPDKNGVGEIWAKGPNVMQGYYKNPEASGEVLTADGWFRTGDFGQFDKKKRLFIRGRMKNTIVGASGENIYPEDIESVINNNQLVTESLVIEEDGFLVAKILLDIESIEKNYEHIKHALEEKRDQFHSWKQSFTHELNSKLNKTSQIKRVDIMDKPFEKTASQKIKRFIYTKNKK